MLDSVFEKQNKLDVVVNFDDKLCNRENVAESLCVVVVFYIIFFTSLVDFGMLTQSPNKMEQKNAQWNKQTNINTNRILNYN